MFQKSPLVCIVKLLLYITWLCIKIMYMICDIPTTLRLISALILRQNNTLQRKQRTKMITKPLKLIALSRYHF